MILISCMHIEKSVIKELRAYKFITRQQYTSMIGMINHFNTEPILNYINKNFHVKLLSYDTCESCGGIKWIYEIK
jgi:hypothetical protein